MTNERTQSSGKPMSSKHHPRKRPPGKPDARPNRGAQATKAPATPSPEPGAAERIAKRMARAVLCSRRDAERWISAGRVKVNGKVLRSPALNVYASDVILVDDAAIPEAARAKLWRLHKRRGRITTSRDPGERPTVFDALPEDMPRVISVGRLDLNTEGLLLLTTSGDLARHLELPETGWTRRYRVRAKGRVVQADLDGLKDGVEVDGVRYGPVEARLDTSQGANVWLTITLREGKNREVRNILASLGLEVNRLIRTSYGPFQLGDLKPGDLEEVKTRILIDQLGKDCAAGFGIVVDRSPRPGPQKPDRQKTPRAGASTGKPAAKRKPSHDRHANRDTGAGAGVASSNRRKATGKSRNSGSGRKGPR